MRVARNHQLTLSGTRASSEGDMTGGRGECGAGHPEDGLPLGSALNLLTSLKGPGPWAQGRPASLRERSTEGGRARVPSLGGTRMPSSYPAGSASIGALLRS